METWSRRRFLGGVGAGVAASALGMGVWPRILQAAQAGGRKRNVLFIAVDDLRPELGCYGRQQMVSPNLDRLAGQGMVFERTYCQQAVCGPSRASLLTGLRPDSTGIYGLSTQVRDKHPDLVTLPLLFKQNGYVTETMGKIYHHWRSDDKQGWTTMHPTHGPQYLDPQTIQYMEARKAEARARGLHKESFIKYWNYWRGPATESFDAPDDAYHDGQVALKAVERLRANKDNPFFLAVGFTKPHLPFCAPQKYWDLYDRDKIDLADNPFKPKGAPDFALHSWGELRAYNDIPAQGDLDDDKARELIHGYYASVSYADAQIGIVLDELKRLGLEDDTIVIVWGDHGWHLGDHGLWCKHSNFETAVHSPMILRVPGQAAGRTAALTEFVDIFPSLADLCDLPAPAHLEGTSFVPLLSDPGRPWKAQAFSQYPRGKMMGYSMRTDRYRYTEWRMDKALGGRLNATELYDHQTDPGENVNIAGAPEHADLVARLSKQLHESWAPARAIP